MHRACATIQFNRINLISYTKGAPSSTVPWWHCHQAQLIVRVNLLCFDAVERSLLHFIFYTLPWYDVSALTKESSCMNSLIINKFTKIRADKYILLSNVGTTLNGVHEKWNGSSKINIIKTTKWASFSSSMNISLLANTMPQCRLYNTNIKMLTTLLNNNLSSAEEMRWEKKEEKYKSDIEKIWIQIQPLHNSMTWIYKLQYVSTRLNFLLVFFICVWISTIIAATFLSFIQVHVTRVFHVRATN